VNGPIKTFQSALPVGTLPPAACAAAFGVLHLVAGDDAGTGGVHFEVDDRGGVRVAPSLPLVPAAVSAAGDTLLVTGGMQGRPLWLRLARDGSALERGFIAPKGDLLLWPQPLEQDTLVWASDPEQLRVWTSRAGGSAPTEPALVLKGPAPTIEVDVARFAGELTVASVDAEGVLELANRITRTTVDVAGPLSPRLGVLGSTLALVVASRMGTVELHRFDTGLRPAAPAIRIAAVAPGRPRAARLVVGAETTYFGWQVAGRSPDAARVDAFGCILDSRFELVAEVQHGPAGPFDAAAWLDSTLVVVSGQAPTITGLRLE